MAECKPSAVPMEAKLKLSKDSTAPATDASYYRSLMGSLRYLVQTRPDITYSVSYLSRFMEKPSTHHWAAVKQILRYIKGTMSYGCTYRAGNGDAHLLGFSDSDHGGDVGDRKSTSGQVFFLGKNLITWSSQKQRIVALSSCEAEYVAACAATCQGVWLNSLLADMKGETPKSFKLMVDNKSAIELSKNPVHHDRSKHIDTRYHFIRECLEDGRVEVEFIGTNGKLADILTKALGRVKFQELRAAIGVVEVQ